MKLREFIPPTAYSIYRKIKKVKRSYKVGNYEIKIPPNHALIDFQKYHKLYDRFLPVLAKNISSDEVIIDVGANIGDTAIALLQHCNNSILCIDASDKYFSYLVDNIKLLSAKDSSRVKLLNKFVGTGTISGHLVYNTGGTATLKIEKENVLVTHAPLDKLVEDISNIIVIKVDVDGFDFDVIMSAKNIISSSQPILFWENLIFEDFQFEGFNKMYTFLEENGYKYIYIFDNFGNLITEETDFSTLKNINSYIYSMEKNSCTRTIGYTDVLASTEKNHEFVSEAIQEYKKNWIAK